MIEPPAKDVSEDWLHDYTLLVLRLNRYITTLIDDDSMLGYYGPPEYSNFTNALESKHLASVKLACWSKTRVETTAVEEK